MSNKLNGKVALVTGASSGIGEATALALAEEGASVAVVARREDRLRALAQRIGRSGGKVLIIPADLTDEAQAKRAVERTVAEFGRLDILVNNAGIMLLSPSAEARLEDWKRMIEINLMAVLYVTHATLPTFLLQGAGHIVMVSSVSGRFTNPTSNVYSATKFGVRAFSESLRQEFSAKHKIRVTVIEPGVVATELTDHLTHEATKTTYIANTSKWERLESEDIAAAILYAVTQPPRVNVNEILIRPTDQG
jgi:NADP-dependent 3-hydroxy acid dehydrogenase YdfG